MSRGEVRESARLVQGRCHRKDSDGVWFNSCFTKAHGGVELMHTASDIQQWESAEVARSIVEAGLTPKSQLISSEWNIARYVDPPAATPYPLEYAFHLV